MNEYMQKLEAAAETIRQAVGEAEIGVILGSGLGDYVEALEDAKSIDYKDIPGFPRSTVPGHKGRWVTGMLHGKRVCMMQGRFHAYEGYDLKDVTMPVRVMALLGVKTLIVTNAAGGVNLGFHPGDLMIITDCINFSGMNPLRGENLDAFGPRFPDMSQAYNRELVALAEKCAQEMNVQVQKGVYCWFNGPCFETPAEIRMACIGSRCGGHVHGARDDCCPSLWFECVGRKLHYEYGCGHSGSAPEPSGGYGDCG